MRSSLAFALLLAGVMFVSPRTAAQTTFIVTTTNDSGTGSLRQAILDANANSGTDEIHFDIPGGGPHPIQPEDLLPTVTEAVTIDGLTQPGADCTSWPPTLLIELDGSMAGFGDEGLDLQASGIIIRGLVINRFQNSAVQIRDGDGITFECNFIGTDVTGTVARGDGSASHGINIIAGNGHVVGGPEISARNLISGNAGNGINAFSVFSPVMGLVIQGNFIGTDVTGQLALGNEDSGVNLGGDGTHTIGGTDHDSGVCNRACNLISGNGERGINVFGSAETNNTILGNFVGTDLDGTEALGNTEDGIRLRSSANRVGGSASGAGNLISGNAGPGIRILGAEATDNAIQGNLIGTDATGTQPLGNDADGVFLEDVTGNTVGGTEPGAGNVIAASGDDGIDFAGADENVVQGNWIGTDATGTMDLGNGDAGLNIFNSSDNVFGGAEPGAGNVVAFNQNAGLDPAGLRIAGTSEGNGILRNAFYGNVGTGIDLAGDGPTANDPGDGDTGPNNLQNYPELASATGDDASTLTIAYTVPSATANSVYPLTVEFFLADADEEEGMTFIGSDTYEAADAEQQATVAFTPLGAVGDGTMLVATATDAEGNTSEFSDPIEVMGSTVTVEPGAEQPLRFTLSLPSPNPFSETTALAVSMPARAWVTVAVYDALGRRVAALHDGSLTAGTHSLRFEAEGLPGGVYLVRATSADAAQTQRVTLLR
ncbi:MAG: T9SS type A sorting domain-containing protein [Rhodothermaceae bacterium]|nr:T9SS type A sorting domain-containing protein [Rhodothermaceae bacterium]